MGRDEEAIKSKLDDFSRITIEKRDSFSEEELRSVFKESGIIQQLGYEGYGKDIRVERTIKTGKRPDIQCIDDFGNVIFVLEFKKPSDPKSLLSHFEQLWEKYVIPLKSKYGILTNGIEISIFERIGINSQCLISKRISDITLEEIRTIRNCLSKPKYDFSLISEINRYITTIMQDEEKRPLSTELARESFLEDFQLRRSSPFSELLYATIQLFHQNYRKSRFLTSAFDFWLSSYARKPQSIPDSWKDLLDSFGLKDTNEDLNIFMFNLETVYSLFTRLILAKACEDYKFPHINFEFFLKSIDRHSFRGDIPLEAWGVLLTEWIEKLRESLVESIFEEDIFYWWTDDFVTLRNRDRDALFRGEINVNLLSFCQSLVNLILTLLKYDFSEIAGDPLGDLYQNYFDKETRKALGEFYTPNEVVGFILDKVDYSGRRVVGKRLLDPACGSGTFIVEALKRYLKSSEENARERGWSEVIRKLCNEFHIVGFDIHPFATIMAQIHFMLILIPYYKAAINEDRGFVLRRIPIFRTDSLLDEREETMPDITSFSDDINNVHLNVVLPIEQGDAKKRFVEIDVSMPKPKHIWRNTDLCNLPEYFCALQALFDSVKLQSRSEQYRFDEELMERRLKDYLQNKNWNGIVTAFEPYGNEILKTIESLKYRFGDGRLVKSIEDVILACLLKNYVEKEEGYDFVVGNPPWGGILKGKRGTLQDERAKKDYSKRYLSAKGKYDIYVLFIERSINWLRDTGRFGFIVQNRFLKVDYGKKIRELIRDGTELKIIVDFGDSKVFSDATNYPCIIVFEKMQEIELDGMAFDYVEVEEGAKELELQSLLDEIDRYLSGENSGSSLFTTYEVMQKSLNPAGWIPIDRRMASLMRFEGDMKSVQDVSEDFTQGITIGGEGGEGLFCVDHQIVQSNSIEVQVLRKVLRGRDIARWQINWNGCLIIYPYDVDGNPISIEDYPNLRRYLGNYEESLRSRYLDGKSFVDWGKPWFGLWRERDPKVMNKPKIICARLAKRNRFAFDEHGEYFILDSCVAIVPKPDIDPYYLLGLLNSNLMSYVISKISPFVQNRYYSYSQVYLNRLPIRKPVGEEESDVANRVSMTTKRLIELKNLEKKIMGFPDSYLIDTDAEMQILTIDIGKSADNGMFEVISGLEGGYRIRTRGGSEFWLENETQVRFLQRSFEFRSLVAGSRIVIRMPRDLRMVAELLSENDRDRVTLSQVNLDALEHEINDLVYSLYDIDDEMREFIEDSLTT